MIILGLWDGHDASACVIADGELVSAVAEERLTRLKMQRGFPWAAATLAMELAGVNPGQVDLVAVAGRYGRSPLRLLSRAYSRMGPGAGPMELSQRLYRHYENGVAWVPVLRGAEAAVSTVALRSALAKLGIPKPVPLRLVEHHWAHAACAAMMIQGDGMIVTMDGYGDGFSGAAFVCSRRTLSLVDRRSYLASVAVTYGSVCQVLGFKEGDEGKVTALAATGDPTRWKVFFERKFRAHRKAAAGLVARFEQSMSGGPLTPGETIAVMRGRPADVAAGLQKACEDYVVAYIASFPRAERIGLAGGLFANVALNRRLLHAFPGTRFAVFPAMGDQGLSVGAAAKAWYDRSGSFPHFTTPYLGGNVETSMIEAAARERQLPLSRPLHAHFAIAHALAEGKTVAVVTGREEFGPRALGNRSLLFPASSSTLADRVQESLGRSRVMPFAPVCRRETIADTFLPPYPWPDAPDLGLGYMTFAVDASPKTVKRFPAAVHVDGTARVQVVTSKANPLLYRILKEYEALSGNTVLINTSFNMHGEPMVHGLIDALDTFVRSGVDLMLLGEYMVHRLEYRS